MWSLTLSCQAIDKFEVLPDLPDPLAYAVQPAVASTVSGVADTTNLVTNSSIGQEPSLVSVILSLAFVVLLIYITGIIYAKLNRTNLNVLKKNQNDFARSQVTVVSTTQLGNNKTLHVVELDGKRMLIGASSGAIQLIKDLGSFNASGAEEEYSHIEIPNIKIPKIEIPKIEIPTIGFSKLVTKTHKKVVLEEQGANSEKKETEEEIHPVSLEENADGIIDSLFSNQEEVIETPEDQNSTTEHIVDPEDFALYKKYL